MSVPHGTNPSFNSQTTPSEMFREYASIRQESISVLSFVNDFDPSTLPVTQPTC